MIYRSGIHGADQAINQNVKSSRGQQPGQAAFGFKQFARFASEANSYPLSWLITAPSDEYFAQPKRSQRNPNGVHNIDRPRLCCSKCPRPKQNGQVNEASSYPIDCQMKPSKVKNQTHREIIPEAGPARFIGELQ